MKKYLIILIFAATLPVTATMEKPSLGLWPDFDWVGTELEEWAETVLEENDVIIYKGFLGLKDGFRSSQYRISREIVYLGISYVPRRSFLNSEFEKKQEGIGGLLINITDEKFRFHGRSDLMRSAQENLAEKNQRVLYSLNEPVSKYPGNFELVSKYGNDIIVMHERALLEKPEDVIEFFNQTLESIKKPEFSGGLWAGIQLKIDENTMEEVLAILSGIRPGYDGVFLKFKNDPNQIATVKSVFEKYRRAKIEPVAGGDATR
jgi:hypothetical protein